MAKVTVSPKKRRNGDIRHGTPSGAQWHSKHGEDPCDACRAAKAEYDKRQRAIPANTAKSRLLAKAQQLALKALKDAHVDEYRSYYLREKAALVSQQIAAQNEEADT